MKITVPAIILAVLTSSFSPRPKPVLLERVRVGKFSYTICREDKHLHEGNLEGSFYVVKRAGIKYDQCSAFLQAVRNDTTFIKGTYSWSGKKLVFREYYYYTYPPLDSVVKVFYVAKNGNLILEKYTEFVNGKGTDR